MKKILFTLLTLSAINVYAQNSIQPSVGYNFWSFKGNTSLQFIDFGFDYEHGLTDQLGLNFGLSHNRVANSNLSYNYTEVNIGIRFNTNELNEGFFIGSDIGVGFGNELIYLCPTANIGYSIPIGNGSLNPNISIGHLSSGKNGYRSGGLYFPINISYSIKL